MFNKQSINEINSKFEIKKNEYLLKDIRFKFDQVKLSSNKIEIKNKKNHFLVQGNLKNLNKEINLKKLLTYYKYNFRDLEVGELIFKSDNNFSFRIDKRFKLSKINIKSKGKFHKKRD